MSVAFVVSVAVTLLNQPPTLPEPDAAAAPGESTTESPAPAAEPAGADAAPEAAAAEPASPTADPVETPAEPEAADPTATTVDPAVETQPFSSETRGGFTQPRDEPYDPEARRRLRDREPEVEPPDPYNREGVTLSLSTGFLGCQTYGCTGFRIGGIGRLGLGYRRGRFGGGVAISIGGANVNIPETSENSGVDASIRFFEVGPFFQFFPIKEGRIDPFIELGLGYFQYKEKGEFGDGVEFEYWQPRGGFRFGVGFPVYARPRFAIGPRFDQTFGFAGEECYLIEDQPAGDSKCESFDDLFGDLPSREERAERKLLPRPWSLTLDARFVF